MLLHSLLHSLHLWGADLSQGVMVAVARHCPRVIEVAPPIVLARSECSNLQTCC